MMYVMIFITEIKNKKHNLQNNKLKFSTDDSRFFDEILN